MALHLRQPVIARHGEQRRMIPGRLRHEMMHRLVCPAHVQRIDLRSHGLDALPLSREQQSRQIRLHRPAPIGVPERFREPLDEMIESILVDSRRGHPAL